MTDRELRLRQRIDKLADENEDLLMQVDELSRDLRLMRRQRNYWRSIFRERPQRNKAWAKRKEREAGRPRLSPCVDCERECRGVRCRVCYTAKAEAKAHAYYEEKLAAR